MTEAEVKKLGRREQIKWHRIQLIEKDLKIIVMAEWLIDQPDVTSANLDSARNMISQMIRQDDWHPAIARALRKQYGFILIKGKHLEPAVVARRAA